MRSVANLLLELTKNVLKKSLQRYCCTKLMPASQQEFVKIDLAKSHFSNAKQLPQENNQQSPEIGATEFDATTTLQKLFTSQT